MIVISVIALLGLFGFSCYFLLQLIMDREWVLAGLVSLIPLVMIGAVITVSEDSKKPISTQTMCVRGVLYAGKVENRIFIPGAALIDNKGVPISCQ